jgi:hypothetical protein
MSNYEVGARMTALQSADGEEIKLLGHGIFKGYLPCDDLGGIPNPCIELDNGKTVWGFQCWWGPEDKVLPKMQKDFPNAKVVEVPAP